MELEQDYKTTVYFYFHMLLFRAYGLSGTTRKALLLKPLKTLKRRHTYGYRITPRLQFGNRAGGLTLSQMIKALSVFGNRAVNSPLCNASKTILVL
ncbi:hypothetical protein HanPSC8_Chr08g0315401 [Helianthus annuus]|nr:hypothetical protein HanPSC8_Chr08g0315401 [Helianthus annuus]